MSIKVRYKGWNVYTDWGSLYRLWKFTETYEPMEAEEGFDLHDRGPDVEPRFQVRTWRDRKWKTVHKPDKEAVRELLGHLPPWNPPPEANRELRDLAKHAKGLEQEIRSLRLMMMSFGSRAGSGELGQQAGAGNGHGDEPACEQENEYLRLTNTGTYANTNDGYRIWELKQDAPSVPVFHTKGVKGKPHAQKGDELWEELDDDDLTPFKLKRGGRRIGNPEWWMVRHLFEGLDAAEERRAVKETRSTSAQYYSGTIEQGYGTGAYLFREALPEIGAEPGDVLIYAYNERNRPEEIYGRVRGLAIEDYHAFRDAVRERHGTLREGLPELLYNLSGPQGDEMCRDPEHKRIRRGVCGFLEDGKKWGAKLKTFHSRLLLVKPWNRQVSEPIRAKSDDGAIFELLLDLGCRPPTEDGDAGS